MRSAFLVQSLRVLLDIRRRLSAERCLAPGLLFFRFPTLFRTIIFIILTGSLMLAQAPSPSLDSLLSQAIELEKDKDYAGAEKIYRQALLTLPDDPEILKRLGGVSQKQLKYEESIEFFRKILKRAPEFCEVNLILGISYYALNQFDKSAERSEEHTSELQSRP